MSKFRARQLDASKPIPIYFQEDISDSSEFNNVTNRTVPQLPTGMEKEEETEHHLQQAIFHHRVIPVPEVYSTDSKDDKIKFDHLYPPTYKAARQMIHIHPFSADHDIPDYDIDSEDEEWLQEHTNKGELLPLDPLQFEEMMDRLEKASGLKAVTLQEAKLLLKDDDDLITAVYDYWLNKRLRLQHPLIPQVRKWVKSEKGVGNAPTDPYVAFRKRTEKMQTRKNRKNDETSYEKILKLRRDLVRAVTIAEMVKRREKAKRELLHLNIEIYEKRYEMEDFNGVIVNELSSRRLHQQSQRPAFAPLTPNHQIGSSGIIGSEADGVGLGGESSSLWLKVPPSSRPNKVSRKRDDGKREKRPYKKKKRHLHLQSSTSTSSVCQLPLPYTHPPDPFSIVSSYNQGSTSCVGGSEDEVASASHSDAEEETSLDGYYTFRRKSFITYHAPKDPLFILDGGPPLCGGGKGKQQYSLASISHPVNKFVGLSRRRVGRGGRVWLDRISYPHEERKIKSEKLENGPNGVKHSGDLLKELKMEWPHFHPSSTSPVEFSEDPEDVEVDVETVNNLGPHSPCGGDGTSHQTSSLIEDTGGGSENLYPSAFYITAEVLDGVQEGSFTHLHVTVPHVEDLEFLSMSDSVGNSQFILEDNNNPEEVDILSTDYSGNNSVSASGSGSLNCRQNNSQREPLTSGNNNVINNNNFVSDSQMGETECKSGISGCAKWTSSNSVCKSSGISVSSNSSSHQYPHSTLDFQTQPSSKFFTTDTNTTCNSSAVPVSRQLSTSHLSSGDELLKLGIPPLSSCSSNTSHISSSSSSSSTLSLALSSCSTSSLSSSSSSYSNTYVKSISSDVSSPSLSQTQLTSSSIALNTSQASSLPLSSSSSSSLSLLSKNISVSSSLANSLTNSLLCASQNLSVTKNSENSNILEHNSKKLTNLSSIYLRQPKDNLQLEPLQLPSGFLLSNNNKNNGNNVLSNSNSNLVSQKFLASWPNNENLSNEDSCTTVIANGPSSKSLENLKCAKVTPILFPET